MCNKKQNKKEAHEMTLEEFTRNVRVTAISRIEASVPVENGMTFRFNVPADVEDIIGYAYWRVIRRAINEGRSVSPEARNIQRPTL